MKWILVALSAGISGHTSITSSSWMDSPEGAYPTLEACQADISAHASASDGVLECLAVDFSQSRIMRPASR